MLFPADDGARRAAARPPPAMPRSSPRGATMQHNDRRRLTDPPYGPSTPPAHPSDAGFRQAILGLVPEELASRIAETFPRLGDFAALRAAIASHLRGAIEEERRGLHTTLRLCVQTFDQVLAGPGVPGDLRAAVRACRGLCL